MHRKSLSFTVTWTVFRCTEARQHQLHVCKVSDSGGLTVWSVLENRDKIVQCVKIRTSMRASKLNSRVLCVLLIVYLISVIKYAWNWGNYHQSVSWDNQLGLWTLILMGKHPSSSTVSVSTLFSWKQFGVLSEGCQSLVLGSVDVVYFLWGRDWNFKYFCPNGHPPSGLIQAHTPPHL
jgi:hypothetical protein